MELTDIRIFIPNIRSQRLLAFASVTLDNSLVVKEIRVLDGRDGWFISMPARKKDCRCIGCYTKNHMLAKFCNECGVGLPQQPVASVEGHAKRGLYEDIVHPITPDFRAILQDAVLDAYEAELERLKNLPKVETTATKTEESENGSTDKA